MTGFLNGLICILLVHSEFKICSIRVQLILHDDALFRIYLISNDHQPFNAFPYSLANYGFVANTFKSYLFILFYRYKINK